MTLIQCYAPTTNSDEAIKDTFYEQLQADLLVVVGDLNAKVGNNANVGNNNTDIDRVL